MKPWSLSKIQCFEQCTMKYKFQYIDKIKQIPTVALAKGSKIHSNLEEIKTIDVANLNTDISNIENNIKDLEISLDTLDTNSAEYKEVSNTIQESKKDLEAKTVVRNFVESNTYNAFKSVLISENAESEIPIGLKIENNKLVPCDYYDKSCLYRGRIDVLDKNTIVDYKTGKAKEYIWQDFSQLEWYSIWLFLKDLSINEINGHFIYVEHNHVNTKVFKRSDLPDMIKRMLLRFKSAILFTNNPVPTKHKSPLCNWCCYKDTCDKI